MSASKRSSTHKRKLKTNLFGGRQYAPCCFCRRDLQFSSATLEHVIPLAHGGGWGQDNLRISCEACNTDRGTEDFAQFQRRKRGS